MHPWGPGKPRPTPSIGTDLLYCRIQTVSWELVGPPFAGMNLLSEPQSALFPQLVDCLILSAVAQATLLLAPRNQGFQHDLQ